MRHDLLFHALLRRGILWLGVSLLWVWRQRHAATSQATTRPMRRSHATQPFPGLTPKPSCATCEDEAHEQAKAPPAAPSPMVPIRGCPRTVDTPYQFCPSACWADDGWVGGGHVRTTGHPGGGRWRQLPGGACGTSVLETPGPPWHGRRVAPALMVGAVGALAEGLGIHAVARVFEVDPHTGLRWLVEAADQAAALARSCRPDLRVTPGQRDELFALLRALKAGEVSEAEAVQRLARSPHWGWRALDPLTKLRFTSNVGERTLAMAQRVVQQVAQVLAPDGAPRWLTDGVKESMTAWLTHDGQWVHWPRRQATGPMPKRRWMPRPEQRDAPVVTQDRRRRLVRVRHRVIGGTREGVQQGLTAQGWPINTAFIARQNLTMRQQVAAVGRRVMTLGQGADG